MITYSDYILEGKQVGNLYHFTSIENLISIILDNEIRISKNHDTVSFTRDKMAYKSIAKRYSCCIVVNGDLLSNKYKIEPFQYNYDGTSIKAKVSDEMEEQVHKTITNCLKYITEVILFERNADAEISDLDISIWKKIGLVEGNPNDIVDFLKRNKLNSRII